MNPTLEFIQTRALHVSQPLGRVALASLFLVAGLGKISAYAGTAGYMKAMGVPTALLPLVIALEVGGALLLIIGWQAQVTAFLLAGFSLMSALLFHANLADATEQVMFLKNIAISGGLLMIFAHGAGAWSLDNARQQRIEISARSRGLNV